MIRLINLSMLILAAQLATAQPNDEILLMAEWFQGTYSTSGESLVDEKGGHQQMRVMRIWDEAPDVWLYLEQAPAANPEEPFRQWIIRIEESEENLYMLEPHDLPDPEKMSGLRTATFIENHVKIGDLDVISGCELFADYDGFVAFSASTVEQFCDTDLRGASILKIRFNLLENKIDWWEQGFDSNGRQLWGAGEKPQVFKKK